MRKQDDKPEFNPEDLPPDLREALESGQAGIVGMRLDQLPGKTMKEKMSNAMAAAGEMMAAQLGVQQAYEELMRTTAGTISTLRAHGRLCDREDVVQVFMRDALEHMKNCMGVVHARVARCVKRPELCTADPGSVNEAAVEASVAAFEKCRDKYLPAFNDKVCEDLIKDYIPLMLSRINDLETALLELVSSESKTASGIHRVNMPADTTMKHLVANYEENFLNWVDETIQDELVAATSKVRNDYKHLMEEGHSHDDALRLAHGNPIESDNAAKEAEFVEWMKKQVELL